MILLTILLNALGFTQQPRQARLGKVEQPTPINKEAFLIIGIIILLLALVVGTFLFVPGTETAVVRNGLNNI